jgi:RHS repeat-associated protein
VTFGSASGGTVSFKYDPLGRRIYKSSSSGTSIFAYDGDNLIEEVNASGTVVARYTQGQNIDEPLAMSRSGATNYYEADGLGSVTSLSNAGGALAQTYTFDSFGKQTNSTGSVTNPFQYTAREFDPETSLYYYRARYYDASVGRFLSEDPLEFAGDGPEFYSYTLNSPVSWVDPMGTDSIVCTPFLPWCSPDPPAPIIRPPGSPQQGGFKYNHPPPRTQPVTGDALNLANCMANCLVKQFTITGGSECTPDGRHIPGGTVGSKHCTNQAIDLSPGGLDRKKTFCCAAQCGAKYINDEGNHWHFQTKPGKNGSPGLLPKPCDCK